MISIFLAKYYTILNHILSTLVYFYFSDSLVTVLFICRKKIHICRVRLKEKKQIRAGNTARHHRKERKMENKTEYKEYRFTDKQIIRCMVGNILRKDLDNGHTEFLETAYNNLGLQDNRRILKKAECMESGDDIQHNLFEFMIETILDEISEENNEFLSFFMDCLIRRFPSITEDAEKYDNDPELFAQYINNGSGKNDSTEKCCKLLYHFCCICNESNMQTIAMHYSEGLLSSVGNKYSINAGEALCRYLGIRDLGSDRSYQKFLSRQRKAVTDYLGIEYRMLERFIAEPMDWDPDRGVKEDVDLRLVYTRCTLHDILRKHALSATYTTSHDEKEYSGIINRVFESLCNSMLYTACFCLDSVERKPASLSELIAHTHIEDPQTFITSLFISSRYELLAARLKKCLNESYKNFSFDHLAAAGREQELASENACLWSENEKLQQKLEQQEDAHRQTIQKMSKAGEKEIHEYMKQIRRLEKQLEAAQKSNCSPGKTLADKARMPEEETPMKKNEKPVDMFRLSGKKILFLGGSPSTVKKLKKIFPDASFIDKKSSLIPDNVDLIVVLTNHIGHSLTQKLEASNSMAKIINCNCTNVDLITQQILEAV